jgi:hypothetical protein
MANIFESTDIIIIIIIIIISVPRRRRSALFRAGVWKMFPKIFFLLLLLVTESLEQDS